MKVFEHISINKFLSALAVPNRGPANLLGEQALFLLRRDGSHPG